MRVGSGVILFQLAGFLTSALADFYFAKHNVVRANDNGEEWAARIINDSWNRNEPDLFERMAAARIQIYRQAAEQGNLQAIYWMGESYQQLGYERESLEWFQPLIDRDDGYTLNTISLGYTEYGGYRTDPEQSMYWLRRSAESGYPYSQVHLGLQYSIKGNNDQALMWYQRAAEQDYPEGCVSAARILLDKASDINNDAHWAARNNGSFELSEAGNNRIKKLCSLAESYLNKALSLKYDDVCAVELYSALGKLYETFNPEPNKAAYYYYAAYDMSEFRMTCYLDYFNRIVEKNGLAVYPDDIPRWKEIVFPEN